MTVETDVVMSKCGTEMSSEQDLVTSDCNGNDVSHVGGDPDNSYVFVSETDGLGDDHVVSGELDVSETVKEVQIENVAVDNDVLVVKEEEKLVEDGLEKQKDGKSEECGVSDVVTVVNHDEVVESETNEGVESSVVTGVEVVSDQNGNLENVEGFNGVVEGSSGVGVTESGDHNDGILQDEVKSDVEQAKDQSGDRQDGILQDDARSEVKQDRDEIGTVERLEVSESEVVADPNGDLDNVAGNETERVEDTTERIDSCTSAEMREGDHQNGSSQDEAKSDEQAQDASGTLESLDGSESEVAALSSENVQNVDVIEIEIKQDENPSETLKSLDEAEIETVSVQPEKLECVAETENRELEDPNERLESLGVAESETVSEQHEKNEHGVETEIKEVEDVPGLSETLEGAGTEIVADQENETVSEQHEKNEHGVETEIKEVEDVPGLSEILAVANVADQENEVAAESVNLADRTNVADRKNDVESETEKVADQQDVDAVESETLTDKTYESVVETEKVSDLTNEAEVETEKATDQTNEGVVDTEKVTDKENECMVDTELQKFEDQVEPESSAAPVDNQESQVQDRELFNESGNENGESGICKESPSVVGDPIEPELQEVSSEGQNEIKLAEIVNDEIPPATTMVTDIDAHPVVSNVEALEEQPDLDLVSDATENQKYETALISQGEPQLVGEVENVVGGDDKQVETVCEVPEETVEKNITLSHVEDISQNDEEPEKPSDVNSLSSKLTQTENEIEASVPTQNLTASHAAETHSEIVVPNAETVLVSPVDSPKPQIVESSPSDHGSHIRGMDTTNDTSSESNSIPELTVSAGAEHTPVNGNVHVESEVSNLKPEIVSNQPDSVDVKLESGSKLVLETAVVEERGIHGDSPKVSTDENVFLQENKDIENSQSDGASVASKEDSSTSAIIEKETSVAAVTKPFNYLIRVPRFNDEGLKERIRQAKLQVEEKTKLRDAIQSQIQQIRADGQIHGVDYEYAKGEIRNARKLVRAKRVEIDSLHYVINKAKNALSIDDIDNRIYSMEHMMQHETLPLKEEKQFIREIKQLKSLRDELSSNMGSDDEIKQALEQREEAEERLKILRKELEKLKNNVQKAEAAAMEAERKYEDENKKVKELQAQFRAANDVRQEAYARWLSLRKELSEKNQYFFKYKDDTAAANNYAFRRDRESLYRLCTDQVEQLMELWNTNEDFRKEYVSFNVRSTVRRFGTLDGRALSPDEEPPILPSYVDERVHRTVSTPTNAVSVSKSVVELKSEATVEKGTVNDKSTKKITENENQKVKIKKLAEPVLANGSTTATSSQAPDEVMNEPVKSKEDIELDRKAEEMRKKEDEAKLKEQRRLEGLAKANEARERKKRQAEKMQMRAELKARKEAEEKEKEREKRLKKKEKKKATDSNDGNNNSDSAPSSESAIEIVREIDAKDMASVVAKKPQKVVKSNKKVSSIPAHIRNRNKKKWQNYAYVTLAGILVLILFWVGNVSLFSDKTLKKPNPFH